MNQRTFRQIVTVHDQREAERYSRGCIAVIDDDQTVREAILSTLESEGYATNSYASAEAYLNAINIALAEFPGPRCLLLDVKMPGLTGLDLQKKLHDLSEITPIIFMSGGSSAREAVQALKNGATDFLIKPFSEEDLLAIVSEALSKSNNEQKEKMEIEDVNTRLARLTDRETQIAHMVAAGLLNRDIAVKLGIALRTVKLHRMHMMNKLGITHVVELARIIDSAKA
jgi:two-component system response regulator FixJ